MKIKSLLQYAVFEIVWDYHEQAVFYCVELRIFSTKKVLDSSLVGEHISWLHEDLGYGYMVNVIWCRYFQNNLENW